MKCPKCELDITNALNYCPRCGVFIGGQTDRPFDTAFLTFLRADLHEFTKLSEAMQAEEIMNYLNSVFDQFRQIIESYKGSIYQVIGDEVVALFGFRKEAGFAPHMALFAAEEMFKCLLDANVRHLIPYEVGLKIGIESDAAFIFNLERGLHHAFIISEGFKKTQLLQKNAENNTVLVGDNLYNITKSFFSFHDAGEIVDQRLTLAAHEIRFKGKS